MGFNAPLAPFFGNKITFSRIQCVQKCFKERGLARKGQNGMAPPWNVLGKLLTSFLSFLFNFLVLPPPLLKFFFGYGTGLHQCFQASPVPIFRGSVGPKALQSRFAVRGSTVGYWHTEILRLPTKSPLFFDLLSLSLLFGEKSNCWFKESLIMANLNLRPPKQ